MKLVDHPPHLSQQWWPTYFNLSQIFMDHLPSPQTWNWLTITTSFTTLVATHLNLSQLLKAHPHPCIPTMVAYPPLMKPILVAHSPFHEHDTGCPSTPIYHISWVPHSPVYHNSWWPTSHQTQNWLATHPIYHKNCGPPNLIFHKSWWPPTFPQTWNWLPHHHIFHNTGGPPTLPLLKRETSGPPNHIYHDRNWFNDCLKIPGRVFSSISHAFRIKYLDLKNLYYKICYFITNY